MRTDLGLFMKKNSLWFIKVFLNLKVSSFKRFRNMRSPKKNASDKASTLLSSDPSGRLSSFNGPAGGIFRFLFSFRKPHKNEVFKNMSWINDKKNLWLILLSCENEWKIIRDESLVVSQCTWWEKSILRFCRDHRCGHE